MVPLTDDPEVIAQFVEMCDGFCLTGGDDVDPRNWGTHDAEAWVLRTQDKRNVRALKLCCLRNDECGCAGNF